MALLGVSQVEMPADATPSRTDGQDLTPYEPLVLKQAPIQEVSEMQFAGHRSHRSHSSHSSHYSGSTGGHRSHASHYSGTTAAPYTTSPPTVAPAPAPRYVPPAQLVRPIVPLPATPRLVQPAEIARRYMPATPTPEALTLTQIELTNGALLFGAVLVKSGAGIVFETVDSKRYKIPRVLLSPNTIGKLNLPAQTGADTALPDVEAR